MFHTVKTPQGRSELNPSGKRLHDLSSEKEREVRPIQRTKEALSQVSHNSWQLLIYLPPNRRVQDLTFLPNQFRWHLYRKLQRESM